MNVLFNRKIDLDEVFNQEHLAETIGTGDYNVLQWLSESSRVNTTASLTIGWQNVKQIEPSALLELLLIDDWLAARGIIVFHDFTEGNSLPELPSSCDAAIACDRKVLGTLSSIGFFRLIHSGIWEASLVHRRHWQEGGGGSGVKARIAGYFSQLHRASALGAVNVSRACGSCLPIALCHLPDHLRKWSTQDQLIRDFQLQFLQDAFVKEIGQAKDHKLWGAEVIASYLIRQPRQNVHEHAYPEGEPLRAGITTARIWDSRFDVDSSPILPPVLLDNLPQSDRYLEIITADSGIGIPRSLRDKWNSEIEELDFEKPSSELQADARILEFATTKRGSRKGRGERSPEDPGLCKLLHEVVSPNEGLLEMKGGKSVVAFSTREDAIVAKSPQIGWHDGTCIRVLVPIGTGTKRQNTGFGKSVLDRFRHSSEDLKSWVDHNLIRDYCPDSLPLIPKEPKEYAAVKTAIEKAVEELLCRMNGLTANTFFLLDWAELGWGDYADTLFIAELAKKLRDNNGDEIDGDARIPIAFCNFPAELLARAHTTFSLFDEMSFVIPVFKEGREAPVWVGAKNIVKKYESTIDSLSGDSFLPLVMEVFSAIFSTDRGREVKISNVLREISEMESIRDHSSVKDLHRVLSKMSTRQTKALVSVVSAVVSSCHLFSQKQIISGIGIDVFSPKVSFQDVRTFLHSHMVSRLKRLCEAPPVCFSPGHNDTNQSIRPDAENRTAIELPNGRYVKRYFRCDSLAEVHGSHPDHIETKVLLSQYLRDMAFEIDSMVHGGISLVLGCSSPSYWYVNQLADAIQQRSHKCGRLVARQLPTLYDELKSFNMEAGASVLLFADVISTGNTIEKMIDAVKKCDLIAASLIVIIDARPKQSPKTMFASIPAKRQFVLIHMDPHYVNHAEATWKIDQQTLEPVLQRQYPQWPEALGGVGDELIALPSDVVLDILKKTAAVRQGHFVVAHHHYQNVIDLRRVFNHSSIRDHLVDRLHAFVWKQHIDVVVYPIHSNIYKLAIELERRCSPEGRIDSSVSPEFRLALRRTTHDNFRSFALPLENPAKLDRIEAGRKLLVLDDGASTVGTLASIVGKILEQYTDPEIHVVVFADNLNPTYADFWRRLDVLSNGKCTHSAFCVWPIPAFSDSACPICKRFKEIEIYRKRKECNVLIKKTLADWQNEERAVALYREPFPQSDGAKGYRYEPSEETKQKGEFALRLAELSFAMEADQIEYYLKKLAEHCKNHYEEAKMLSSLWRQAHTPMAASGVRTSIMNRFLEFASKTEDQDARCVVLRSLVWFDPQILSEEEVLRIIGQFASYCDNEDIRALILYLIDAAIDAEKGKSIQDEITSILGKAFEKSSSVSQRLGLYVLFLCSCGLLGPDDCRGRAVQLLHNASGLNSGVHWNGKRWADRVETEIGCAKGNPHKIESLDSIAYTCATASAIFKEIARCADIILSYELKGLQIFGVDSTKTFSSCETLENVSRQLRAGATTIDLNGLLGDAYKAITELRKYWFDQSSIRESRISTLLQPFVLSIYDTLIDQEQEVVRYWKQAGDMPGRRICTADIDSKGWDTCICDQILLEEWMRNAIDNAWKYGGYGTEQTKVKCGLRRDDRRYILDILNTGCTHNGNEDFFPRDSENRRLRDRLAEYGVEMHIDSVSIGEYVCRARLKLLADKEKQ